MPKLYACIISPDIKRDRNSLVGVADMFASSIEVIEDGVLFDVSGLERLVGKPDHVARKIVSELKRQNIAGQVAVAETVDTAKLLARCESPRVSKGDTSNLSDTPLLTRGLVQPDIFQDLPLRRLNIERDTLNVFSELGLHTIKDLGSIPLDELVGRYGHRFSRVIDVIEQRGRSLITPNIKENKVSWSYELNNPVEDFEQLIFLLNHGLDIVFEEVKYAGFSIGHIDLGFKLRNKNTRSYEIKTSFPTLDRSFWLKLINLRVSLDPPEELITAVDAIAHFTKPRTDQRGLYAVSRPEPESLLLTVNKLKKLVGEENVGVPVLLNQRLARPFKLDSDAMPDVRTESNARKLVQTSSRLSRSICGEACFAEAGQNDLTAMPPCPRCGGRAANLFPAATEKRSFSANRAAEPHELNYRATIALNYFRPPIRAEVLVREGRLVFVKTHLFSGHVTKYSGMWRANSHWWDRSWRTQEWDIEVENNGVYRLCKVDNEWFLSGEYD
ncbi:MAG: hypothetical protein ABL999_18275 [Pyrinomonadaceae bacterium]